MLLNNLRTFCKRREIYNDKFACFLNLEKLSEEKEKELLELLCEILMDSEGARNVSECFPQLLLVLLNMSINKDQEFSSYATDADLVHRLNCTIIGKLILIHPDALNFALQYFEINPAPFENPKKDVCEPNKTKKSKNYSYCNRVTDYELVEACYNILQASPHHFKYKWNWSKFYKYLINEDDKVKWLATKCVGIILEMSELLRLSCARSLIDDVDKFIVDAKDNSCNTTLQLEIASNEIKEITKNVSSVISVAGVLLPVFKSGTKDVKTDLVSVESMDENLRSLALAVASRKGICLQGVVGCGKTALVEYLAKITGHGPSDFIKVQLGDQTDSKMLLGTYRCTDIPGEFVWQPGVLTQAVIAGKWLLLEDIDCAALDVASILSNLMETGTLSVPGYRDIIHVKSGFQLFVTQRLIPTASGLHRQTSGATSLLEKYWLCVNMEPLSKEELVVVIRTLFPILNTIATRMVDVFLLFSVGNHRINTSDEEAILATGRLISTRDLIKWCSRATLDFVVSSPDSALKIFQDAIDIFCCSVSNQDQRLALATSIGGKLGIIKTKAEYFSKIHKPAITISPDFFVSGRSKIKRKKTHVSSIEKSTATFSFTRPSACLLERIACCVQQSEPVLLVGETGTGKTSSIQYLARSTGNKLVVINMNQQSESADLLGGYKPVDLKFLIFPIREEFEILFRSYFAVQPNREFLNHIGTCYAKSKWKILIGLMNTSTNAAIKRLKSKIMSINGESKGLEEMKNKETLKKWERMSTKLDKLASQVKSQLTLAFAFIEGSLIKALKEGHWVLLDEINLANAETLECLSGLLEGSSGSLSLLERGDKESVKRHPDFTIFACMNPATDVGKKELPVGLRNRFTEFYVDELTEKSDLQLLVGSYLNELNLPATKQEAIVKFYLKVRKEATWNLFDGTAHKPHYSLRTLCRALSVAAGNPCGVVLRSLYEAFCLSFLTQLDHKSYPIVQTMIVDAILDKKTAKAVLSSPIPKPRCSPMEDYIEFEGYWVVKGSAEIEASENYILTETVRRNLRDVVRVVSIGKMPLLLQGDTSVGKTSLITYLAKVSGHVCVRINNHEHTDLQEYVGSYVANESGKLVFKEGILVEAMRKGYWIILDELNLAPSDVLEALNRVLDDNRELFIPETQKTVRAHENFMLFATQNPPGVYGGRKVLSRAFRNRFVELHFDEIPAPELQTILHERCSMPVSYCKQIIGVMTDLQVRRKNTAAFAGKQGFITLRDLFRWGERYRLAPEVGANFYDWSQHLADEGYLVLAAKVRKPEEAEEIREVIKKHLKRDVNPRNLFTLSDDTSPVTKSILEAIERRDPSSFEHVVWTYQARRMAVLAMKSYQFKEPVLLVGETGGGKTTICQLIARMSGRKLYAVNCHMHTESSDFLGNLRPTRCYDDKSNRKLFEWVDGPLITAMQNGDFFLADEISLADDSVLERLNSLLEPERSLLLSEKGIDVGKNLNRADHAIVANEDFFFIGTMNPGGDYGKKELSPALRNRFTEIWCDGCTDRNDLRSIVEHNLDVTIGDRRSNVAEAILTFLEWLSVSDVGKRFTVSIRDISTWVNFINICIERVDALKLNLGAAYYQGACLTYIDALGSGSTSMESVEKLRTFKESAVEFLKTRVSLLNSLVWTESAMETESKSAADANQVFGIYPFFISRGSDDNDEDKTPFVFLAPTTRDNTLKLLRALQLQKPILLEGSPGVGKTSLVSALAKASGHVCSRINLSDQTDVSDLFGADLPVEGGKGGEFAWRDGPFLRALRAGHWILLDELNLASQSVLEGLNACFDHRGEVYIPELGKSFLVKSETKLFACQNPLRQGGARRGLPKSFLNRFTQVFVDALTDEDLKFIAAAQFPNIEKKIISRIIELNTRVATEAGIAWGFNGAPWEMNLRDVSRCCEMIIASAKKNELGNVVYDPGSAVELIYVDRMRTKEDKMTVRSIYKEIFPEEKYSLSHPSIVNITDENVFFGQVVLQRSDNLVYDDQNLLLLRDQMSTLRSLAKCISMNWMSILVGGSGCGKSSVVRVLAQMVGQKLKSIVVNSAMDTTEILGGFEQTDYNRHLEQLVEKTENLLIKCLKTKVRKETILQIEKYQSLIERVRELSQEECESVTMNIATEAFLYKIENLLKLLQEMKIFDTVILNEIEAIEINLEKLKELVMQDKCLNAGGKFEWIDSILVKCLQEGTWLLIDQVNLCSPAVLDRLNGLLEPNGVLSIGERGVDSDGNVITIRPHKNFKLFLTMDPKYGEISRAMRNRGVEIFMFNYNENLETGKLDSRSLLYNCNLKNRNHQEALMTIHKLISEDPSNVDSLNIIQLLHTAFLIVQQLSRGFSVHQAFKSSCTDVYLRARSIFNYEARMRLSSIIDDTIRECQVEKDQEYVIDLDAATCTLRNLLDNSKLTLLKQQGFLLDWCTKAHINFEKNKTDNGTKISLKTEFINEFFTSSSDQTSFLNVDVFDILPYILLNFYENSSLSDVKLRKMWISDIIKQNINLEFLDKKNSMLVEEILFFDFEDCDNQLPWNRKQFKNANNLALLLYYITIILNNEMKNEWKIRNREKITLAQFSQALLEGKTTIKLNDQPLITNYVPFLLQVKRYIENMLRKSKKIIDYSTYMKLRLNLKWYSRFCNLSTMMLINKSDKSNDLFENLDEIVLLIKVHYKWLKKCLIFLDENYADSTLNDEFKEDSFLQNINKIDKSIMSVYDPFRKICKTYKKYTILPLPYSSATVLNTFIKLQKITESFSPSKNKYMSKNLIDEPKFITFQTEEALIIRSELISLWHKIYNNEAIDENVFEVLENMNTFCETRLNIVESFENYDLNEHEETIISKEVSKMTSKIQLWPIHEYMFILFAGMFQRKLCENLREKSENITLPSSYLFIHHFDIPNIPVELLGILNTICDKHHKSEERNRLIFYLFIWFFKFSENSYAIKNFKQITHWQNQRNNTIENETKSIDSTEISMTENLSNGPILVNLVSELLFNKFENSNSKTSSVIRDVTLDNHGTRLEQLKTINNILWKNSVAINSEQFDSTFNDLKTLRSLINNFLAVCSEVEGDISYMDFLDNKMLTTTIKSTISNEYLKPLENLRKISENLTSVDSNLKRGEAWALLGYLQTFIFGNMGYIDPVHKIALKLRYVEEDITDCERTIYIAKLYTRILGLVDNDRIHPMLQNAQDSLKSLTTKKEFLSKSKAVRPANTEFIALSKEFTNFRMTLGSYTIVNQHVQQLIEATTKIEIEINLNNIKYVRTVIREAEIWLESSLRFMNQLEAKFLSGYPDIVLPILLGLAQLRHGIQIIKDDSSRRVSLAEMNVSSVKLESFLFNLMRFPIIGPGQDFLTLVNRCISPESRKLLNIVVKSENTFFILQEQFKLMIAGLYEFYNYVVMKGTLTKDLWHLLKSLLHQISLIWQQQQKEKERREAEKDNLYKNQIKISEMSMTEAEEINQELLELFPTQLDNDFADVYNINSPSLEESVKIKNKTISYDALIGEDEMKEVQNIHSNIVRSFTSSEWLNKDTEKTHPDFFEPLLQRCGIFGHFLDNARSALGNELTVKLHTSLNVLTQIATRLGTGEKPNPESSLNAIRNERKHYDFYKSGNVEEVKQCLPLLESILKKVSELAKEWPEHPTLTSMRVIIRRIHSFPVSSAVSRFLTGLELLLVKMHEWEENAHTGVSLTEYILALTQQIISWRKLELSCWKDCLATTRSRLRSRTAKWWFYLYALFEDYTAKSENDRDKESITSVKLIESLEMFMNTSPLVEYEARLELILTFHYHAYYLNSSIERDEILAISWNVYNYFRQFLSVIEQKINLLRDPIEKKLKDFVKIARWNDISYWAVKETVAKTHRTLHKFIKEYETGLKETVTPYLIVKPSYKSEAGIWDKPENSRNFDINPNDYVINVSNDALDDVSYTKSDLILRADTHYLMRARKLCKEAVLMSSYPNLRVSFEEFVEEFTNHSIHLRALEIDKTLPKPKQKSQAKSILQQKRMALSDYFRTLIGFGVSHRIGTLTWNNKQNEVIDFTIPPLNVKAALKSSKMDNVARRTLDQWDGIERYYYGSLIKLNALNNALLTNKTDLGAQNMEWCKGFSTHLMIMANKQKKTLIKILKYLVNLRSQILDLSSMNVDDLLIVKQEDLWNSANNLKELLITAQTCFEQYLIYLQSCPSEARTETDDFSYSLSTDDLAIVNCKSGDVVWEKANSYVKKCLNVIVNISERFKTIFPELHIIYGKNHETELQVSIMTSKHFTFMKESFISLRSVKENLHQFAAMFYADVKKHPLLENITFLEGSFTRVMCEFDQIMISSDQPKRFNFSLYKNEYDRYESNLEKLVNIVLIVIQDKYKNNIVPENELKDKNSQNNESSNEETNDDEYERNKLREKLIESIETDIKTLKLKEIYNILNILLKTIFDANSELILKYCRLLKKCLPLLQQYILLVEFYLNEQVASLRITCKILYMQLNVFLDLATNGFCVPKDLDLDVEEGEEGSEEKSGQGGMGLGDGEGQKDVSDRIETEDQLDDAKPAGQENEKPDDKDYPEEDKGIEMSENFEGKLQDLEKDDDDADSNDEKDDEDMDDEMGDTNSKADKLDEQIWGEDEDEIQDEETKQDEDEIGDGERIGEKQFGNKDDKTQADNEEQGNDEKETKQEQQKEINEMEEPEYDEDHENPYHGKHQPQPEPEPLDLPEDINMDDDDDDENNEEKDLEENPFDIDKMKETMPPPETEEKETAENEETKEDTNDNYNESSDEENECDKEKSTNAPEEENEANDDDVEAATQPTPESHKENKEEENLEETEKDTEDKATPSTDEPSKEIDASKQIDETEGGSRDQVDSGVDNEREAKEESNAENWQEEKKDKGIGQSQAEQHSSGHSGSSNERINPMMNLDIEEKQNEKRKHPGKSDENHTLAEQIEPDKKKLKTMIYAQEKLPDNDNNEEGIERDENNDSEMCQHVKEKEKFDHYAMDAATEEQSKEQISSKDQEEESKDNEKSMDIEMHEDEEVEILEDENIQKQNPEKLADENKAKPNNDSKEKGRIQDGQLETNVDVEGETMETMKVTRGIESTFFTNISEIENDLLSTTQIEKRRTEVEKMMSQWTQVPTTEEAIAAWNSLSAVTEAPARDLSEKLRLVLEPTQASRLRGDYRTGKRINMRKIIPYIASQFRKDKIWLRRTKPSKRNYQIVLAIDDSSSMADNHSKELAFESLSLISKAMTYLEAGQLSVLSFGEETSILHALGEPFSERSGSRLMQEMSFKQKKTMVGQLVDFTVDMFQTQCNAIDNAKLLVVLSDGRGVFSEGTEKVNRAVRRARIADIFLVFIIVDNPLNKDSILDIRMPVFEGGKLTGINPYMDSFPFPFYMILRDINALPGVLSDALRQWFEVVGKIDT